ncbi:uncharacterized protein BDZ99DRAFT_135657 [Mytilinidion resinicola]|uniref:Ricin B lectin domain-containing protein n=1 Tax=Mytilinidion resinicola TaxID=574789 RepID=A0A6A6Z5V5_9PEZI|nr:uncharacterized protein BDZ99DRAFT_135657 [Mytilinidion resinicola]KAF2816410.1 hypothetical protein BDZ99DRAFT_135657 [Mytilinidion resinicola]
MVLRRRSRIVYLPSKSDKASRCLNCLFSNLSHSLHSFPLFQVLLHHTPSNPNQPSYPSPLSSHKTQAKLPTMHFSLVLLSLLPTLSLTAPTYANLRLQKRTVTTLDPAAFAEAQVRDPTATRAFSSTTITTSSGLCLFVDELSGDFRANLTPVQAAACDGSDGQSWDVITAGKHDDRPGTMLVVSTLVS